MSNEIVSDVLDHEIQLSSKDPLIWTKSQIEDQAQAIVFQVSEGLADPLQEYIRIRKGQEVFNLAEKNLKPYIDGIKVNKGELYYGCEIIEKEQGVKYDYSACGDQVWNELNEKLQDISKSIKERENFLKGITTPLDTYNATTGETFQIMPAIKSGKLGKSISIK